MIIPFREHNPKIGKEVFIAPDAQVIGNVELKDRASVFFGAVLRGDILPIRVGKETNIQEHAVLHTSHGRTPTEVGDQVTIGHRAIIHGAHLGTRVLVGMGAIVLDETIVEDECLIGAGAVVTEGTKIPARSLVLGVPAKVVRPLSDADLSYLNASWQSYVQTATEYRQILKHNSY